VGVVVGVTWAVLAYNVNLAIIPGWEPMGTWTMVNTTFGTTYFYYIGMLALAHGIIFAREHHAREVAALEEARASVEAQLHVLKMELQPHFLFNTLHAISALMHRDVKTANEMLVLLADMLDSALQTVRDQEVTLEEELKTLKLYMQIQQIRFGDRLHVDYAVDPEALGARVPHLIFQPLVENAVKHGIADRAAGGQVEVSAQVSDQRLHLAVQDDGPGLCDTHPTYGIGLSNTQERLSYLYGEGHRFELRDAPGGGVRAMVTIPLSKGDTVNPGS
jgi:LytS/YehU family sensor histidine kinase